MEYVKVIKTILILSLLFFLYSCNDISEEKIKNNLNYYLIGMTQYKSGDFNGAIKSFKEDYKRTKNIESLFKLAEISSITGDPHNAEDYLKKIYNQNPNNDRAVYELAFLYKKMGRFNKSLKLFSKLLDNKRYLDNAYYHMIDIYVYLFKIKEAEELFKSGLGRIKNPYKIDYVFVNYFYDNDKEKFKNYYNDILLNCKDYETLNKLTDFFFVKEDIKNAYKVLKKMEIYFPNDPETLTTIGQIYLRNGDFKNASDYFKKVEKTSPKNLINKINIATSEIYNGNTDKAEEYLRNILKIKKDSVKALVLMGFVYLLKGDKEKAFDIIETIKNTALALEIKSYKKTNPLVNMYFAYYDFKKEDKYPSKKDVINFITGNSQELLALKADILNELGLYDEVLKLKLPENIENDKLIKQIIIADIFLKKEKDAYRYWNNLNNEKEIYKFWLDYVFKNKCEEADKKYDNYKNNHIFIDIYTNCLIKKKKFKEAKKAINEFMKENKLSSGTKDYLKRKIMIINYKILQQQ